MTATSTALDTVRLRFIQERFKGYETMLLFYVPSTTNQALSHLARAFLDLAECKRLEIALHDETYVRASGVRVLASVDTGPVCRSLKRGLSQTCFGPLPAFTWHCDAPTWTRYAGLIEGLLAKGGHHYLASDIDDSMIMVSSGEYYDSDFD